MPTADQKDIWDKLQAVGLPILGIGVTTVLAIAANTLGERQKERETQLKFIEIATSLIRDEPRDGNHALREWAVDILVENSKAVPLSEAAQKELKARRIPIYSSSNVGYGTYTGGTWDTGQIRPQPPASGPK